MKHLSGAPLYGKLLPLPTNIRLSWKALPGTNALAYYEKSKLTSVKSFITLAPESGKKSGHHRRWVEDRRVHDLPAVEAEAPVADDGDVERLGEGEAALVRYHVDNHLRPIL